MVRRSVRCRSETEIMIVSRLMSVSLALMLAAETYCEFSLLVSD